MVWAPVGAHARVALFCTVVSVVFFGGRGEGMFWGWRCFFGVGFGEGWF